MRFKIPANIGDFTTEALRRLRAEAVTEYNETLSLAQQTGDITTEGLNDLDELRAFVGSVDEALGSTDGSGSEPADSGTDPSGLASLAPLDSAPGAPEGDSDDVNGSGGNAPTVGDIAGKPLVSDEAARVVDAAMRRTAITASAGLHGFTAGQEIGDLAVLANAMAPRLDSYRGLGDGSTSSDPVATFKIPGSEFVVRGDRSDLEVVDRLVDESRLPGGSLLAARTQAFQDTGKLESLTASGWCAPSEIDYSVQFYGAATGLYDVPTLTASRGGVWIMPEIAFNTVFGTAPAPGSSYFNLTEAQVIAGTTKTFVTVDCPTPTEYRLGVTGFGAVANLLQLRAYPEYVREYIRASLIGLQHFRSLINIAAVVAASTAVPLTAALPWTADATVLSVVLPAAEMAAVDQRYAARLGPTATIEQVFPIWVLAQMRADFMRRNGTGTNPSIADAWIMNWFREQHIAPQFVYNWQDFLDATNGGAGYPGDTTPVTQLPTTLYFLSYAPGTWVNAVADVIQLSTVYDSIRLASNERVEMFTEQGNIMMQRRADSRAYSVDICPSGDTGQQRAVTCAA